MSQIGSTQSVDYPTPSPPTPEQNRGETQRLASETYEQTETHVTSALTMTGGEGVPVATGETAALTTLTDDELVEIFQEMQSTDEGLVVEVITAAEEMKVVPWDRLDQPLTRRPNVTTGVVERRAPRIPLSHTVGLVEDPALQNNPLRGRLLVTFCVNFALFFVFFQSLLANKTMFGDFYAPKGENHMKGPKGQILYLMGGLNTNAIRNFGEKFRVFWSMWLHAGWIHVVMNVICQVQFMYMYEPDWGSTRVFGVFGVGALTGNLISSVADPCTTTVGSSGGLFALLGSTVVFVLEYWRTIPRPLCMLIFIIIVAALALLQGFSGNTDNWAHMGGLFGGICFAFMSSVGLLLPPKDPHETFPDKKQISRFRLFKLCENRVCTTWDFGWKSNLVRLSALTLLVMVWAICFCGLLNEGWYTTTQPIGHVTFEFGAGGCCCCMAQVPCRPFTACGSPRNAWFCYNCDLPMDASGKVTWGETCEKQFASAGKRGIHTTRRFNSTNVPIVKNYDFSKPRAPTIQQQEIMAYQFEHFKLEYHIIE